MDHKNTCFGFKSKTHMEYGAGISASAGKYINEIGFCSIGILLDDAIAALDVTEKMLQSVKDAGISYEIFRNSVAEPDYDYLDGYKERFSGKKFDALLGVGGGSTLDLTKAMATLMVNPGNAIQYRGFPKLPNLPLPVIAVPTTAGTGSEVTYNAVFTDSKQKKKLGINSEYNYPVLAILDPLFTLSCPKSVTVSSGMDALTHTLESFVHRNHTPVSRMFSREAFRFLFNNLMIVLDYPDDIGVRGKLQLGAYLAGIALINSGSGPAGALSYPLGVHYKVPHGMAGAIFLNSIVEHNVSKGYRDYCELYDLIEGADKSIPAAKKSEAFLDAMKRLAAKMAIPGDLSHFGLKDKDAQFMIDQYDVLKNAIGQNPVEISKEDLSSIIGKLKKGKDSIYARI